MAEKLDPKEVIAFEELLISNMFEIAALIEILDHQGIVTKPQILEMIQQLRRKTPRAQNSQDAHPEPYMDTETSDRLIHNILALMNDAKLTSQQARVLLERVRAIVDAGELLARKTTH